MTRLLLSDAAKAVDSRRARSRQRSLGPSSVGVCRRRAGYEIHRTPVSNPENGSGMAAISGTWFHTGALQTMRSEWGAFTEVTVEDEPLRGHIDAVFLPQTLLQELGLDLPAVVDVPTVDDLKTKADRRMIDTMRSRGPAVSQLFQVHLYADMLRRGKVKQTRKIVDQTLTKLGPIDVQVVQLRYVSRAGDDDEYLYQQAYDPQVTEEAWEWVSQVTASARPEDLPRDEEGPGLSYVCGSCEWLTACWGEQVGGLPVQTQLVVDDTDLTEALDEYHRGLVLTREGDQLKQFAKAKVTGQPPAIYRNPDTGDAYRLGWSGGKPVDPKPDVDAMVQLLTAAEVEIPLLPPAHTSRSISVAPYEIHDDGLCGQAVLEDGVTSYEDVLKAHRKAVRAGEYPENVEMVDPGEVVGSCLLKPKHTGKHAVARSLDENAV